MTDQTPQALSQGQRVKIQGRPWIRTDIGRVGTVGEIMPTPHNPSAPTRWWVLDDDGKSFGNYTADDVVILDAT